MTFILVYVIFATAFETAGSDKPKVISAGDRSMTAQNLVWPISLFHLLKRPFTL